MNNDLLNNWYKKVGAGLLLCVIFIFFKWYNYNYYSISVQNKSEKKVYDVFIRGDDFELVIGFLSEGVFKHKTGSYIDIPDPVTVVWDDIDGRNHSVTLNTDDLIPSRLREVTVTFYINGPDDVTIITSDWKDRLYKGYKPR